MLVLVYTHTHAHTHTHTQTHTHTHTRAHTHTHTHIHTHTHTHTHTRTGREEGCAEDTTRTTRAPRPAKKGRVDAPIRSPAVMSVHTHTHTHTHKHKHARTHTHSHTHDTHTHVCTHIHEDRACAGRIHRLSIHQKRHRCAPVVGNQKKTTYVSGVSWIGQLWRETLVTRGNSCTSAARIVKMEGCHSHLMTIRTPSAG